MSARQHKRVARIPGTDVEKCHDEVAVDDLTGRELAGEDSTKDTWIHASPFWRTGREPTEESLVSQKHVLRTYVRVMLGINAIDRAHTGDRHFQGVSQI